MPFGRNSRCRRTVVRSRRSVRSTTGRIAGTESFIFHAASLAIDRLGNNGSAQIRLRHRRP
jgi:hypothetical protein